MLLKFSFALSTLSLNPEPYTLDSVLASSRKVGEGLRAWDCRCLLPAYVQAVVISESSKPPPQLRNVHIKMTPGSLGLGFRFRV